MEDFGHGAASHVSTFLGKSAVSQVAASMLGIGHVHVADDIDDAAVRLFGEAFVLAAVAGFHVEYRNVQAFCRDCREAAVGVAQDYHRVGLASDHELVAAIDDVANCSAEVVAHGIHVDFRIL